MEWLSCVRDAVDYMEEELLTVRDPEEVAGHVHMSCVYLQRGFQILTGYSLGEYIRNRRLYLAAVELCESDVPVIDIALKYGYETPASFDKAFSRFHGATPLEVRRGRRSIRSFLRLQISISIQGGSSMNFRVEKKDSLRLVGFEQVFRAEDSYEKIPKYWDEITAAYAPHLMQGQAPEGETERFIAAHHVGEFGVCIDDMGSDRFHYMIAGYDRGDPAPETMTVRSIAAGDWAVFDCTLATLQSTNTAIWKEWLPGNSAYELAGMYNLEWYSPEGLPGPDRKCQIWLPVRRRNDKA